MGEGEGGMIWENGTETCIISYVKRIASLCSMQDAWGCCTGMIQRDDMVPGSSPGGSREFEVGMALVRKKFIYLLI